MRQDITPNERLDIELAGVLAGPRLREFLDIAEDYRDLYGRVENAKQDVAETIDGKSLVSEGDIDDMIEDGKIEERKSIAQDLAVIADALNTALGNLAHTLHVEDPENNKLTKDVAAALDKFYGQLDELSNGNAL